MFDFMRQILSRGQQLPQDTLPDFNPMGSPPEWLSPFETARYNRNRDFLTSHPQPGFNHPPSLATFGPERGPWGPLNAEQQQARRNMIEMQQPPPPHSLFDLLPSQFAKSGWTPQPFGAPSHLAPTAHFSQGIVMGKGPVVPFQNQGGQGGEANRFATRGMKPLDLGKMLRGFVGRR